MGGSRRVPWINLPSNLAALCEPCHSEVEKARSMGYADGWLVHDGVADQLQGVTRIRVVDAHGVAWILSDDGTKHRYTMADYDPEVDRITKTEQ